MLERRISSEILLRELRLDDAEELFELIDANRGHLRTWLPWLDMNTEIEHTRHWLNVIEEQHSKNLGCYCAIFFMEHMVGAIDYHCIRIDNKSVQVGYWLSHHAQGKGIMTRCCRFMADYAFRELGYNRVAIAVAPDNVRSRAIPLRLGFKEEGILREAELLHDHYTDHVIYSLLRREWLGLGWSEA